MSTMVVEWSAPLSDGGCPLDGYLLEYRAEGSSHWMGANREPVEDCRLIVSNLIEDINYQFRVAAQNKAGVGEYSDISTTVKIAPQARKYLFNDVYERTYTAIVALKANITSMVVRTYPITETIQISKLKYM